jgi:predicted RNase H-like HicB family nuclease
LSIERSLAALGMTGENELEGEAMSRYLIVIENAGRNYSAYSPDLPGCASTGATIEETRKNMEGAVEFHVGGLREDGLPIPPPSSIADYVEVPSRLADPLPPSMKKPRSRGAFGRKEECRPTVMR